MRLLLLPPPPTHTHFFFGPPTCRRQPSLDCHAFLSGRVCAGVEVTAAEEAATPTHAWITTMKRKNVMNQNTENATGGIVERKAKTKKNKKGKQKRTTQQGSGGGGGAKDERKKVEKGRTATNKKKEM